MLHKTRRKPPPASVVNHAFGRVLRELRTEAGLSQDRLAQELESGRTYVSELERGIRGPTLRWIVRLADLLGLASSQIVVRVESIIREAPASSGK